MKAYTDLDQSKKLAEILSLESADMCYWCGEDLRIGRYKAQDKDLDIPCWSLAVLLDIIPYAIHISDNKFYRLGIDKGYNNYAIWYEDNGCTVNTLDVTANNFVDACYEMILKIYGLKIL